MNYNSKLYSYLTDVWVSAVYLCNCISDKHGVFSSPRQNQPITNIIITSPYCSMICTVKSLFRGHNSKVLCKVGNHLGTPPFWLNYCVTFLPAGMQESLFKSILLQVYCIVYVYDDDCLCAVTLHLRFKAV